MISRRRIWQGAALGAAALWVWGLPRLAQMRRGPLDFNDIAGSPPFRRLVSTGTSSPLNAALVGLDATAPAPALPAPCDVLFDGAPTGVAFFTDVNCPNCPPMETAVTAEARAAGLTIHHRMLPIRGPSSELAARAYLAAGAQPDPAQFRAALLGTRGLPTVRTIATFASDHGLDPTRLRAEMAAPETDAQLAQDRNLARRLGLIGTPATVIGRTVMLGHLPRGTIRHIIALEQEGPPPCA